MRRSQSRDNRFHIRSITNNKKNIYKSIPYLIFLCFGITLPIVCTDCSRLRRINAYKSFRLRIKRRKQQWMGRCANWPDTRSTIHYKICIYLRTNRVDERKNFKLSPCSLLMVKERNRIKCVRCCLLLLLFPLFRSQPHSLSWATAFHFSFLHICFSFCLL